MTDDEQAFLRAAAVDPYDDTLQLAYADWLDEQGGQTFATQAGFVRLQVRRSRLDVFDPARADLLDAEATLLRTHRRDWNGRVHRLLRHLGLPGKVDARKGAIRGWEYHRGMIARVTVDAERGAAHLDLAFALGPVQSLKLVRCPAPGWRDEDQRAFTRLLPRLVQVTVTGPGWNVRFPNLAGVGGLGQVPLLDMRSVGTLSDPARLFRLVRAGSLPPVVLFRRTVSTPRSRTYRGRAYPYTEVHEESHVIDPFGKWDGLRPWYADLTGETLSPIPYHGTSR